MVIDIDGILPAPLKQQAREWLDRKRCHRADLPAPWRAYVPAIPARPWCLAIGLPAPPAGPPHPKLALQPFIQIQPPWIPCRDPDLGRRREMNLIKWVNKKIGNLTWIDMGLTKISVAAFILMIAKLWPPLLSLDWYWYGLIFIALALIPLKNFLKN